ncbi:MULTISPECIES: cellulose biosynthesis protein BcsE [Pseudoalteromonas]|uniref:cellulose biosynthesis protein BcsE n=1 Tax=Pseudoalteromonas TaxID=53246 RepID=UPI0003154A7B|nr:MULTISPECIES: cellulose biosynthesis protein BcsE [Pseudoalteromonas]MCF6143643.1 hypothetical protein [Pseudoalteromonas mariniglutinosa NCIMB 1770]
MPNFKIEGLNSALVYLKDSANYTLLAPLENQVVELALQLLPDMTGDVFILSEQIDLFFESAQSAHLNALYEQGKVHPFSFNSDPIVNQVSTFNRSIINELKAYKELKNSLVLIHFNATLITHDSTTQLHDKLALYSKLATTYQLTVVFIITGSDIVHMRKEIQKHSRLLDGILYVSNDASLLTLEYDYWRHNEGVIAQETVYLDIVDGYRVTRGHFDEMQSDGLNQDFDENDVWLVKSVVPEGTKLPHYYHVTSDNDALYQQASQMKAATLVFSVTRYTDLAALARQCFTLRKHCGKKLKLVIQNVDGIIRHQDECLFLTLGVNLILYSFSEPSRLLSQIQSIQGFHFSRPLPHSIEHVLQYSESAQAKGFLPFMQFADQVVSYSNSAVNLGVSGVLVVLQLLPRIEAIHPLQLFHVKREGDIFSTVGNQVFLYLHACREHDVENAIKHLFKLQISDFFESKSVLADHFFIQQECRRLKRHYTDAEIPDYTMQLKENVSYIFDPKSADIATLNTAIPEFKKVIRPFATKYPMTLKDKSS